MRLRLLMKSISRTKNISVIIILVFMATMQLYGQSNIVNVICENENSVVVIIDPEAHEDYGVHFPITYSFILTKSYDALNVYKKYSSSAPWVELKDSFDENDIGRGTETARVENSMCYVSVSFGELSDSIFIKFANSSGEIIPVDFKGITRYYDNRKAVVTSSADDWNRYFDASFNQTIDQFRKYKIPITVGVISDETTTYSDMAVMTKEVWESIQTQLDRGFVEVAAHSRNHLHPKYPDSEYEVAGCKQDLIDNLDLPDQYKNGNKEYVYVWIAPFGEYDDYIHEQVIANKFLVSRMYTPGDTSYVKWNKEEQLFGLIGHSIEIGAPYWGGGETDISVLNSTFDKVYKSNGVYHFMCHPSELTKDWETKEYLHKHLSYISKREDVWYTSLGHLYLYQLVYQNSLSVN